MTPKEKQILRDLARQYREICNTAEQTRRRNLWRQHNSFRFTQPPIYIRSFASGEMEASRCEISDPFFRHYEDFFRDMLFRHTFEDDFIFEPWVTVDAVHRTPPEGLWGLPINWISGDDPRGAKQLDPPIKNPEDFAKMVEARHRIDEAATAEKVAKLEDALGDLVTVNLSRGPAFRVWNGDISTHLCYLRGIEQMMWDIMDRPDWLQELLAFMRDGILRAQTEAEAVGDWGLADHENQAMPYAEELADPAPNQFGKQRQELWYFCASQETTLLGPAQFNEFMLQYQIPIMAPFGLVAYGCCEDLSEKIEYLRQIPNLRRIAVSPMANVARCAEQIERDYILSYRPSPSDMVGFGFDEARIRRILREDFTVLRDSIFDITLKDVETVQSDPTRIRKWVRIVREEVARVFG